MFHYIKKQLPLQKTKKNQLKANATKKAKAAASKKQAPSTTMKKQSTVTTTAVHADTTKAKKNPPASRSIQKQEAPKPTTPPPQRRRSRGLSPARMRMRVIEANVVKGNNNVTFHGTPPATTTTTNTINSDTVEKQKKKQDVKKDIRFDADVVVLEPKKKKEIVTMDDTTRTTDTDTDSDTEDVEDLAYLDPLAYEEEVRSQTFTGASFVVNALVSAGVTHVFGGHGGAVVPLIDAIVAHPQITWVYCRCEVNASQMAAAYAKLHQGRKIGCCLATSGPGAGHLLSGLVDADQDRVPVLCITGMKPTGHIRHANFQDIDQASIFRMAGLALSETVGDINQLVPLTRNAMTIASTSNRCAHLAIPINVQQQELLARTPQFGLNSAYQRERCVPATKLDIATMIATLRSEIESKRHVMIACGYRAHPMGEQVERIAELMHAPILTSFDGKGTVNERHPLAFGVVGVYGNAGTPSSVNVLDDCDTVIAICCSDLSELITSKSGAQIRRLIQIDERLVAGDTFRFNPSTVFACGHLKHSLQHVIAGLERSINIELERSLLVQASSLLAPTRTVQSPTTTRTPQLLPVTTKPRLLTRRTSSMSRTSSLTPDGIHKMQKRMSGIVDMDWNQIGTHTPTTSADIWEEVQKESYTKPVGTPSTYLKLPTENQRHDLTSTTYCHPAVFFNVMKDKLDSDAVICADIGDNALWMASSLAAKRGQSFLTSEHMGIMGMALNAGVAASLSLSSSQKKSSSSQQTLVVAGDGGFQMSLNELATLKDHGSKNVLVIVIVNKRLGRVQNETWGDELKADGCGIGAPDFVKLFESYGYPNGIRLDTCDPYTISDVIDQGWNLASEQGCAVIELQQDPNVHPIMHKLKPSLKKHQNKSLKDFTRKFRKVEDGSLFPGVDVQLNEQLQDSLLDWVNTLTQVEKSTPVWVHNFDFVTDSLSELVEKQLASLPFFNGDNNSTTGQNPQTQLFESQDDYETFDLQLKGAILNCFSTEMAQDIVSHGTCNTHAMCFQVLCCPKGYKFLPHGHPNAEIMIPLVGECWEKRFPGVPLPANKLQRLGPYEKSSNHPSPSDLQKLAEQLKQPGICQFIESPTCMDRAIHQSQLLCNPPGSIHQTYTKEEGCLLFVMWSGLAANFSEK